MGGKPCSCDRGLGSRYHRLLDEFEGEEWWGCIVCRETWVQGGEDE